MESQKMTQRERLHVLKRRLQKVEDVDSLMGREDLTGVKQGKKRQVNDEISSQRCKKAVEEQKRLVSFYDMYPSLAPLPKGRFENVHPLEKEIENAVKNKDYAKSQALSDQLARETVEHTLNEVQERCDYMLAREQLHTKEVHRKKKKKELNWGMDPKKRWEQKGNMG